MDAYEASHEIVMIFEATGRLWMNRATYKMLLILNVFVSFLPIYIMSRAIIGQNSLPPHGH